MNRFILSETNAEMADGESGLLLINEEILFFDQYA
jgi:hypothetical protein